MEEKSILRIVGPLENLGQSQMGVEATADPLLGYTMWGGKDAQGFVTRFLAKGKPASVTTMQLTATTTTGYTGYLKHDANGNITGGHEGGTGDLEPRVEALEDQVDTNTLNIATLQTGLQTIETEDTVSTGQYVYIDTQTQLARLAVNTSANCQQKLYRVITGGASFDDITVTRSGNFYEEIIPYGTAYLGSDGYTTTTLPGEDAYIVKIGVLRTDNLELNFDNTVVQVKKNTAEINGQPVSTALNPMVFLGDWEADTTYSPGATVNDVDFKVVANAENTGKKPINTIGAAAYTYTGDFTETTETAKSILYGIRHTFPEAGYIGKYKSIFVVGNRYEIYSVEDPLGSKIINQLLSFEADTSGPQEFSTGNVYYPENSVVDLVIIVYEPDPAPTEITANYNYQTPNNITLPASDGDCYHSNKELDKIYFYYLDFEGNDRTLELQALTAGDIIHGSGQDWAIQIASDEGTYIVFTVAPASQGSITGFQEFRFETTTATPITYNVGADAYLGNSNTRGLLALDGVYENVATTDSSYSTDLYIQGLAKADEWDIFSTPGSTTSGGGSTPKNVTTYTDYYYNLASSTVGSYNQQPTYFSQNNRLTKSVIGNDDPALVKSGQAYAGGSILPIMSTGRVTSMRTFHFSCVDASVRGATLEAGVGLKIDIWELPEDPNIAITTTTPKRSFTISASDDSENNILLNNTRGGGVVEGIKELASAVALTPGRMYGITVSPKPTSGGNQINQCQKLILRVDFEEEE